MSLTPEDVSNKRFTTVRLREGYDMPEVDQFLDEVESALQRLTQENASLRAQLGTGEAAAVPETTEAKKTTPPEEAAEPAAAEVPAAPVREPARVETLQVSTTAEASVAATRLLELAGRNADELVAEAQQSAEQIVGKARTDAEKLEADARARSQALDDEVAQRRQVVFGALETDKAELDREIENLRTFEREYRAELRTYFEDQLAALEGQGSGGSLGERDAHQQDQPAAQG